MLETSHIVSVLPMKDIKKNPVRNTPNILPIDHAADSVPYLVPILENVSAYFFKSNGCMVPTAHAGIKNR